MAVAEENRRSGQTPPPFLLPHTNLQHAPQPADLLVVVFELVEASLLELGLCARLRGR